MTVATGSPVTAAATAGIGVAAAAALPADAVLRDLGELDGRYRLRRGPAAADPVRAERGPDLRGPAAGRPRASAALALLLLLALTAVVSAFLREAGDALIIGIILVASSGLGFVNEYRAERAGRGAALARSGTRASWSATGAPAQVDVTDARPGRRRRGCGSARSCPADLRLLDAPGWSATSAVLTGESVPVDKAVAPVAAGRAARPS